MQICVLMVTRFRCPIVYQGSKNFPTTRLVAPVQCTANVCFTFYTFILVKIKKTIVM